MKSLFCLTALLFFISSHNSYAKSKRVKYKTRFENCPSQVLGRLTLNLIKSFEKKKSLFNVKTKIVNEKLADIYYLQEYKIFFDPLKNKLNFYFKCPTPMFKLDIVGKTENEMESGVLAESGKFLSHSYLSLLKNEGKFTKDLPLITIIKGDEVESMKLATKAGKLFLNYFDKGLSELIVDEKQRLTAILSIRNSPITIFFGQEGWSDKIVKLKKTVLYLDKNSQLPKVINLIHDKKVVVKFSDNN